MVCWHAQVWLRVKNQTTDSAGAFYIFFDSASGGGFTSVSFPLNPNDNDFRDIFVDLTANPKWVPGAKIYYFRLDPVNSSTSGTVYVDFIRLVTNKPPLATSLTVKSAGEFNEIKGNGTTLQFFVSVLPAQADSTVKWTVDNQLVATIDTKGLLTAVSNGLVTVKATAKDGSGISGSKAITISLVTSVGGMEWANMNVYPNPATNQLTVSTGQSGVKGILISDLVGRTVYTDDESFTGSKTFGLTLAKGIYLVRLTGISKAYKLIVN